MEYHRHGHMSSSFITYVEKKYIVSLIYIRLYVIFVDMIKCFDSIYRNGLWLKMYKCGIQGKLLRIVRDMYQKVKPCV